MKKCFKCSKILEIVKGLGTRLGQVSKLPRKVHFSFQLCYLRVLIFPPWHECEFIDFVTIQEMQIFYNINTVQETVQDFLIKLGIKPLMHLLERRIFSLVRLTKIMNNLPKISKFWVSKSFLVSEIGWIFPKKTIFCEEYLIRRPTYID